LVRPAVPHRKETLNLSVQTWDRVGFLMSIAEADTREEIIASAIAFYDKVMSSIWIEDSILILQHKDGTKDELRIKI